MFVNLEKPLRIKFKESFQQLKNVPSNNYKPNIPMRAIEPGRLFFPVYQ